MTVPFPYPGNMTSVMGLLNFSNTLVEGFLGTGILIAIAVISFLVTKAFSTEKSFAFSGFLTLLSAILLRFMSLISDIVLSFVVFAFVGIVIWLFVSRNQEVGA